ncbi:histidine phosphatase family protein [Pseudomonas sp. SCB32]|uniref:lipopolysaccharide core heptose(II)-phosphate phosphatase PmrG n=1 Tax=Pseudomonas sp. SCB32 TaxID=2653853 RepID=UPI001264142F|nr:histidine phosphatase family protein [Pseudomonas sp. SCB32]
MPAPTHATGTQPGITVNPTHAVRSIAGTPYLAILLLTVITLALCAWRSIVPQSLDNPDGSAFQQRWRQGQVILLIRHLERCDRSSAPCLGAPDGITARAAELARGLGQAITHYGLAATDIYSSPLTRTAQTADLMFNQAVTRQDWLVTCKNDDLLGQIRQHKTAHRNLVLVTHSECFDRLMQNLDTAEGETPEYGETLVLFDNDGQSPWVAGEIEAPDWVKLAPQPNAG